jgi:nucleoid DNA-binding protein
MSKRTLIQLLADQGRSEPAAADQLDRAVAKILRRLRNGETVSLPGLGRLVPSTRTTFSLEKSSKLKGGSRGKR